MSQILLYGTRFCPYCVAARRLLSARGIDYQDISVDRDPELRARVMAKSGRHTVPQIWFGSDHIGGFTELRELERQGTLDRAIKAGLELGKTVSI